jgi:hypothetical protein
MAARRTATLQQSSPPPPDLIRGLSRRSTSCPAALQRAKDVGGPGSSPGATSPAMALEKWFTMSGTRRRRRGKGCGHGRRRKCVAAMPTGPQQQAFVTGTDERKRRRTRPRVRSKRPVKWVRTTAAGSTLFYGHRHAPGPQPFETPPGQFFDGGAGVWDWACWEAWGC